MTCVYCSRTLVKEEAIRRRNERISFMLSPLFICVCLAHLCLRVFSYIYLSFFFCFFFSCSFFPFPSFYRLLLTIVWSLPFIASAFIMFIFIYFLFLLLFPSAFPRSLSLILFILSCICLRPNTNL